MKKAAISPIYSLADGLDDQPFDLAILPFQVYPGVWLKDVRANIVADTFGWLEKGFSSNDFEALQNIRYALVTEYEGVAANKDEEDIAAEDLLAKIAACLRLIRPTRQQALQFAAKIREDGAFDAFHVTHPVHLVEVPEAQKLFSIRTQDVLTLSDLLPKFLYAFEIDCWKLVIPVQFFEYAHFDDRFWKSRFILWVAALDGIFTTQSRQHNGKAVATARIKFFLGETHPIFEPGDLPQFVEDPKTTVGEVIDDIYTIRNFIAHGEKIPDCWFSRAGRRGLDGESNYISLLIEAANFILRKSIIEVLKRNLVDIFADPDRHEDYFSQVGLIKANLLRNTSKP